ncbi:MAG: winged helix-turn-helix transcriptional regulator [Actinomycetota bacterium]
MRSYGQYCALARALDVVGDRWTLLIIRELFARDCRYSDLREALPGIATNLLAARLRQLQVEGVIESYEAPPPVRATVYRLTPRGRELAPALRSLVAWGAPLLTSGQAGDSFRTHWLALVLRILFKEVDVADLAPLTVLLETGDESASIEVTRDGVEIHLGDSSDPDVKVEGQPEGLFTLLSGTGGTRTPAGIRITGPREAVRRLHTLIARSPMITQLSPAQS